MTEQSTTESTPYGAFLVAQRSFHGAVKDSNNPFFKSKYADLSSVWGAASVALHENGLTVMQPIRIADNGSTVVVTTVRYKDGTVIETSECPVICKAQNDPQALGSAITYARRYSLASILCIITEDDDGETAMNRKSEEKAAKQSREDVYFSGATPPVTHADEAALLDWQSQIDSISDVAGLNRCKKDIGASKLESDTFKKVWGMLSARGKKLGATYDSTAKTFS